MTLGFGMIMRLKTYDLVLTESNLRQQGRLPQASYHSMNYYKASSGLSMGLWSDVVAVSDNEQTFQSMIDALKDSPSITESATDGSWVKSHEKSGVICLVLGDHIGSFNVGPASISPSRVRLSLSRTNSGFKMEAEAWTASSNFPMGYRNCCSEAR